MYCSIVFLVAVLVSFVLAGADYYAVLGVPKDADEKAIKTAYRSLSKKYHPDKNPGDDTAQQKFIEIGAAYEVLMDKEKRQIYDQYGEEGLQNGGPGGPGGQGGGDPFDMFSNFFGGGRPRGRPRGGNVDSEVDFTLKDFYNGANRDVSITLQDICDQCSGTGSEDGKMHTCPTCHGRGRVIQKRQLAPGMFQQFESACPSCRGSGKQIDNRCHKCSGEGVYRNKRTYNVNVTPGLERNHGEVFQGEADKSPSWDAGDLRFILRESKTGNLGYRRIGNNLYRTEVISLKESLSGGWARDIPFLDDYEQTLPLSRKDGVVVQDGETEKIPGKGMPILGTDDQRGDLFIEYRVIYPAGNPKKLRDEL